MRKLEYMNGRFFFHFEFVVCLTAKLGEFSVPIRSRSSTQVAFIPINRLPRVVWIALDLNSAASWSDNQEDISPEFPAIDYPTHTVRIADVQEGVLLQDQLRIIPINWRSIWNYIVVKLDSFPCSFFEVQRLCYGKSQHKVEDSWTKTFFRTSRLLQMT